MITEWRPYVEYVRSCLFLDFDNVFSGLKKQSPALAAAFAKDPGAWFEWLENYEFQEGVGSRRVLVRKCYINPQAYGEYRPFFVKAGFQVIDCPPLTGQGKNGADIHMVVDALGYMDHKVRYDEFIVMSADADFTPLLVKLREHDRSTFVVTTGLSSLAYRNSADACMDTIGFVDALETVYATRRSASEPRPLPPREPDDPAAADREEIRRLVKKLIVDSGDEMVLANLSFQIKDRLGHMPGIGDWFGYKKFKSFLESLRVDSIEIDSAVPGYARIKEAVRAPKAAGRPQVASTLTKAGEIYGVPQLTPAAYGAYFKMLSQYLQQREYDLTETSKSLRDAMASAGFPLSRKDASFILVGIQRCLPLNGGAKPGPDELSRAFLDNVRSMFAGSLLPCSEEEEEELRRSLGG